MIEVSGLVKTYGTFRAVDGLSLHVAAGEILGLVGPNGAGKTTTLRCVTGIVPPTEGRIAIGGHDLVGAPIDARRILAFVPDEPRLFDYLTARDHLALVARLYGVADGADRGQRLLEEFALADRRDAFPSELSRGMKQTIARTASEGAAVILSSHMLHLVEEVCNRVLILQHGRALVAGTLEEIRAALPGLERDADLEDIFLRATEGPEATEPPTV